MDSFLAGAFILALTPALVNAQSSRDAERVLDRSAYVRSVLAANPSIEAARTSWRAARARARQAGAFDDPIIDLSMAPLSIDSAHARFGYQVGIRQELPWFGKRALDREALEQEAASAASDLETTRRDLALQAVVLYDRYYVALRSLEINAEHSALLQSLQAAASAQFEAGRAPAQDTLQAEAELAHLEHDAIALAAERDLVVAQMNELLHRDPAAPLSPPVRELASPVAPEERSEQALQREAIDRRAEIASARLRARAESLKVQAAERAYYPNLTLMSSYSSMWDMPQHRFSVGIGMNVPLPTERRAGAIDEAHAAQAHYASEVERMSDMAKTQVYIALRMQRESEQLLDSFQRRLLPVAREQIEAARSAFVASQTSFMTVVEAERNLRNVELDRELAEAECDRRQAELARALGRIPGLDRKGSQP